jgi:hypothetical protein
MMIDKYPRLLRGGDRKTGGGYSETGVASHGKINRVFGKIFKNSAKKSG